MGRLSGLGLTLKGMLQAQVEDALPDPPDEFCETLVSHGPAMFMEAGEEVAVKHEALVGVLRVAVEVGLQRGAWRNWRRLCWEKALARFGGPLRVRRWHAWPPCG